MPILRVFVVFLRPSRQISPELSDGSFLPNPFQFIVCLSIYLQTLLVYCVLARKGRVIPVSN
jgi:hypothetical protein